MKKKVVIVKTDDEVLSKIQQNIKRYNYKLDLSAGKFTKQVSSIFKRIRLDNLIQLNIEWNNLNIQLLQNLKGLQLPKLQILKLANNIIQSIDFLNYLRIKEIREIALCTSLVYNRAQFDFRFIAFDKRELSIIKEIEFKSSYSLRQM